MFRAQHKIFREYFKLKKISFVKLQRSLIKNYSKCIRLLQMKYYNATDNQSQIHYTSVHGRWYFIDIFKNQFTQ